MLIQGIRKCIWLNRLRIYISITINNHHKFIYCKNSWDEWVPESRVLKYNEANVQRQREVQRAHSTQQSAQKNKKGNTTTKAQGRRSEGGREKDTDSRASTPVSTSDKSISRFSKGTNSTVAASSSHESTSEPTRKKRRFVTSYLTSLYNDILWLIITD